MKDRSEARVRTRVLRTLLLLAIAAQVLWSFRPSASRAFTVQETQGRALYQANCSSCHGLAGAGTQNGPTLNGVGPAAVDFMLSSGRMPLSSPNDQPQRQQPKFTPEQIDAITAYVSTIGGVGPGIPSVDPSAGELPLGAQLFLNNCSGCHGAAATGDSVGGGQIAPNLYPPTATQVGEAVRIGPGVMPKFDPQNLSQHDVNSIGRYLEWLREDRQASAGGIQLGRVGAVAEGLIVIVVGLGLLVLVLRLTGGRT